MKNLNKKELFKKISNLSPLQIKNLGLDFDEINYIKYKLLNDKLGLVLNFEEKDELLDQNYFGLKEVPKLHINPKEKNNNLLIEGDNYYALKALKISRIKVDIIYIDPPYNTGNKDFTYNDEYVDKEDNYRHSKWLTFMKKRLIVAKDLLKDDGVIFISIDDNEQAYLKVLMDEIFGEQNFVSCIIHDKRNAQNDVKTIEKNHEYILFYSKNIDMFKINVKYKENESKGSMISLTIGSSSGGLLIDRKKLGWTLYYNEKTGEKIPKMDYSPNDVTENSNYSIYKNDDYLIQKGFVPIRPPYKNNKFQRWTWSIEKANSNIDKIIPKKNKNNEWTLNYIDERNLKPISHKSILNSSTLFGSSSGKGTKILNELKIKFSNPKNVDLMKFLIDKIENKSATILDFFAGSGTTAHATMELNEEDGGNRRFILCTNNENNIARDICRERIYRVINGKGSNNEDIAWKYSKDKKSFINNSMKYLKVKAINKFEGDYEDINKLKDIYLNEFNKEITIKDFQK